MTTINELQAKLARINDSLSQETLKDEERILLENDKTKALKAFHQHLKRMIAPKKTKINPPSEASSSDIFYWIKVGALGLISLIGLAESSIFGYLSAGDLFGKLTSSLGGAGLTVIGVIIAAMNVILFTAFEIDLLKKLLGISNQTNASKIMAEHDQQLDLAIKINAQIEQTQVLSQSNYQEYKAMVDLSNTINSDIETKKLTYQEYVEHPVKTGIRWILTGCGALLTCLGSYWSGVMLVTALSAPLVGTPAGWIIISFLAASSIIMYFAMQGSGIRNLLNPTLDAFQQLKGKLSHFAPKHDFETQSLLLNRSLIRAEPTKRKLIDTLNLSVAKNYKRAKHNSVFFADKSVSVNALLDYQFENKACRL